jgi:hypothetical protein
MGKGSVGGQSIVGIPIVRHLRDDPLLQSVDRLWPFEIGFLSHPTPTAGPYVLHGEIWPGVVHDTLDPSLAIRDQAQVRAVVHWLRDLDIQGQLGVCFAQAVNLSPEIIRACVEEEGWILGASRALKMQREWENGAPRNASGKSRQHANGQRNRKVGLMLAWLISASTTRLRTEVTDDQAPAARMDALVRATAAGQRCTPPGCFVLFCS